MNPIKKFCAALLMSLPALAYAQKVTVIKETERVKGQNIEGYATELTGNLEAVRSAYIKYLKTFSKFKATENPIQLNEIELNTVKYQSSLYAVAKLKGERVLVWLGIEPSEWQRVEQADSIKTALEKIVYDFGVKYYRDVVQVDIDESVRAQQAVEKQTLRLQNENKSLISRLEFNQKEKIRLEKALLENKIEHETLLLDLARNKKAQDSIAIATDQIKKMVELHKERQRKVN